MRSKETVEKWRRTLIERYGKVAWNKGLDKNIDSRLKKQSENMKGHHYTPDTEFKFGHQVSELAKVKMSDKYNYEKHHSILIREKRRVAMKKKWQEKSYIDKVIPAQRQYSLPTRPEKVIAEIIAELKLPFVYTGNGAITIGKFNPDFLAQELKKVIEVNGDYWHNLDKTKEKDVRKMAEYNKQGFACLVIWENEIKKDLDTVKIKLQEFTKK